MNHIAEIYKKSLGLLTDLYQLTMAFGYWKSGMAQRRAVFYMSFRKAPFNGVYAIACGIDTFADWIDGLRFSDDDLEYLKRLKGSKGESLFTSPFLDFLGASNFSCNIDAVREGDTVFPYEPMIRVEGPLWQAQWIETALLTIVNFQTLIATKASRVCQAAGDGQVLEFGLRRAQGIDGGLAASRAAVVGGCGATSNVLAGKLFDVPVRGTHAHSWVMAFDEEQSAFEAYVNAMPHNSVLLVDTYDTVTGVKRAIEQGLRLKEAGYKLNGIRLDSGDLGELAKASRKLLDEAGLTETTIVASNDLDEYEIQRLRNNGAPIDVWGVGTKLATAYDQPALGGVYKLSAIENESGVMRPVMKRSNQRVKQSLPGHLNALRLFHNNSMIGDVVSQREQLDWQTNLFVDRLSDQDTSFEHAPEYAEPVLYPLVRSGKIIRETRSLKEIQDFALQRLDMLPAEHKTFEKPMDYPVVLDTELAETRRTLMSQRMEATG